MTLRGFISQIAKLCALAAVLTLVATCGGGGGGELARTMSSITILGIPAAALMPGNSVQLSARADYSDQSTKDVTAIASWSTTDTSVVSVSAKGLLAANAPGQAEVIATLSGVTGRASVQVVPLQVSAYELRATGDPELMIAAGQFGLYCIPDGHITFSRTPSWVDVWFAGGSILVQGGVTLHLRGKSFETLAPDPSSGGNAVPVFLPGSSGFDKDYAGPGAVVSAANGTDLLMIYHAEAHCATEGSEPTFGIGLARSSDAGLTWTRQGQIISSSYQPPACTASRLTGAGNPVAVMTKERDYYYMYFVEWFPDRPDEIRMARSPVSADAAPGSWTKYYRGEFSQPGLGGLSDPVIQRPSPEDATGWTGFPSVSYNAFLERYLAVFVTGTTFHYTASEDGIHWEPARSLGWGNLIAPGYPAGTWFFYPSLLSLDQPSDGTTTDLGYLYYAHGGVQDVPCHFMERRAFQIVR